MRTVHAPRADLPVPHGRQPAHVRSGITLRWLRIRNYDTVQRRIADGTLHGYRLGKRLLRVDLNEIDAALREIPSAATRYGEL